MWSHVDHESDARRSRCPGPLAEVIRLVRQASVGELIAVMASDPAASTDIPAWVAKAGHTLVAEEPVDRGTRFVVRRDR